MWGSLFYRWETLIKSKGGADSRTSLTPGVPGVKPERYEEGLAVKHCALSLVGEPIMYPEINTFIRLLHSHHISSFLVTNAQFPQEIRYGQNKTHANTPCLWGCCYFFSALKISIPANLFWQSMIQWYIFIHCHSQALFFEVSEDELESRECECVLGSEQVDYSIAGRIKGSVSTSALCVLNNKDTMLLNWAVYCIGT